LINQKNTGIRTVSSFLVKLTFVACLVLVGLTVHSQAGSTTFGIQVKPVIPLDMFNKLVTVEREHLKGSVELTGGFAFGMTVRVGITNAISFETGLGQIKRRYEYSITNDTSNYSESNKVRYLGYELPITGLVHIRLGEQMWMNAALGASIDMYPSEVRSLVDEGSIDIARRYWAQLGILGNLGVEYRTRKSGTIYLGGTFHRPFNDLAPFRLIWGKVGGAAYNLDGTIDGSYLTVDLRYYFHEDPQKRRVKRAKK